jgi:phosphatidylserine/phosphatidylglycerophosphate/cardiolipin synthase-like enzyme
VQARWVEDEELTAEVLERLILGARRSLEIATADLKNALIPRKGGPTRDLVEELYRLASSGVEIRLLHSSVPSESFIDRMRETALHELRPGAKGRGSFTMRRCVRTHLKLVVSDGEQVYLGTANLTGAGLGAKSARRRNFEAGIVSADPEALRSARALFSAIWDGIFCPECGRRARWCPAPLEEPTF